METKDLAIVLRTVPFQERSQIVTALTERHGKISAVARNSISSRRFGGTLAPFVASHWHLNRKPGAELWHLKETEVRHAYEGLRGSFEKLSFASVFSELMLRIAPSEMAAPEVFRLHLNALRALEVMTTAKIDPLAYALLNLYIIRLLQWSGTQPQLRQCTICAQTVEELVRLDEKVRVTPRVSEGRWACETCSPGASVAGLALVDILSHLSSPIREMKHVLANREQHGSLLEMLQETLAHHVPGFDRKPLQTLRFI